MIANNGDNLPVKVRVLATQNSGKAEVPPKSPYYSGKKLWTLNPRFALNGHFNLPEEDYGRRLVLTLTVSVIDQYDREHFHLPIKYRFKRRGKIADWILEP